MERYAIYFAPLRDHKLWNFGCASIGYDSAIGQTVPLHKHRIYQKPEIHEWTRAPRRYGFHATLKAPFHLAEGKSLSDLKIAASEFCLSRKKFFIKRLEIMPIGDFLALVPAAPSSELNALAKDCVKKFEAFRAPLNSTDYAKRLEAPLTKNQISHLNIWGYPYVLDEFRFHMTLTGRLPKKVKTAMLTTLRNIYAPLDGPVEIGSIAICSQSTRAAQFKVSEFFEFGR